MGFSNVMSGTGAVLPSLFEADAAFEQSRTLRRAATEQTRLAKRQAAALENIASDNQMRASRNAYAQLGHARADAAVSNTAREGTTYRREMDLASRLQDEISAHANEQLSRANHLRSQAAYDAWDLRNQSRQSRLAGVGAVVSGVGSLMGSIASGLKADGS